MSNENFHLMIVDDQESIRKLCMTVGASLGLRCTQAESAESALARLDTAFDAREDQQLTDQLVEAIRFQSDAIEMLGGFFARTLTQ